jgi:hypothetical protein
MCRLAARSAKGPWLIGLDEEELLVPWLTVEVLGEELQCHS